MIGIVGCGNMGEALIKGLTSKFRKPIIIYDKDKKKLKRVSNIYKAEKAKKLEELVSLSKVIIIAVKPQDINEVLEAIRKGYSAQLLISIVAGISTSFIEKEISKVKVIRVMPNLAAKVFKSISCLSKGRFANNSDLKKASQIFESVGSVLILKEKYINAVTALSGSGPGYIFYFLYCLEEAAYKLGFSRSQAHNLVFNTIKGAANLIDKKDDFLDLVNKVASKGGTTEAALRHFKKKNFKRIIEEGVNKAYQRAKKLSR